MKIELNLWFNKNQSINGRLNINAGEVQHKFTNIEDIDTFIMKGIAKGIATQEEFIELAQILNLDPDARYAWIGTDFIYWNSLKKVAHAFYETKIYSIPVNNAYTKKYASQPDICFEVKV